MSYRCGNCFKDYATRQSLWKHRPRCGELQRWSEAGKKRSENTLESWVPPAKRCRRDFIDDDDDTVLPAHPQVYQEQTDGTASKEDVEWKRSIGNLINKIYKRTELVKERPVKGAGAPNLIAELVKEQSLKDKDLIAKKTVKEAKANRKCMDDSGTEDESSDSEDEKESDTEDSDDEDAEDVEKVLPGFIDEMIAEKGKRLLVLVKDDVNLKNLVTQFLTTKEASKDMKHAVESLKASARTAEIEMLLNQIELENARLTEIFRRLRNEDIEEDQIPEILQSLKREGLISQETYEELAAEDKYTALSLPFIIKVLKENVTTTGDGVIQYLPGSVKELENKLQLLVGEYEAGNIVTAEQIIPILNGLLNKSQISRQEHTELCNKLCSKPVDDDSDDNYDDTVKDPVKSSKVLMQKGGKCYRVRIVDGNGLFLKRYQPGIPVRGDGLFLKKGSYVQDGSGLLFGPNSPFKNIPILGLIL